MDRASQVFFTKVILTLEKSEQAPRSVQSLAQSDSENQNDLTNQVLNSGKFCILY